MLMSNTQEHRRNDNLPLRNAVDYDYTSSQIFMFCDFGLDPFLDFFCETTSFVAFNTFAVDDVGSVKIKCQKRRVEFETKDHLPRQFSRFLFRIHTNNCNIHDSGMCQQNGLEFRWRDLESLHRP